MSNIKKCNKCGQELPLDQFYKRKFKNGNIGHQSHCKDCGRAAIIEWRSNNPERVKAASARYRKNNPEKVKAASTKYREDNMDKVRVRSTRYERNRRATDPSYKLVRNIRNSINTALSGNYKSGHTIELLGCSIEYLRTYLEKQFKPGMTWNNYGKYGWHIDHIIPVTYFDHSDSEQQWRAWHYTNLRPLWAKDNLKKNKKIIEIQLKLL